MYYNIEITNNLNIDFIDIVFTIIQYLTCNAAEILVFNSDTNSHFCTGYDEQAQELFWNSLKTKSHQQVNQEKLFRNAVLC